MTAETEATNAPEETPAAAETGDRTAALEAHGPCPVHRRRFVNVRRAAGLADALESVGAVGTVEGGQG